MFQVMKSQHKTKLNYWKRQINNHNMTAYCMFIFWDKYNKKGQNPESALSLPGAVICIYLL